MIITQINPKTNTSHNRQISQKITSTPISNGIVLNFKVPWNKHLSQDTVSFGAVPSSNVTLTKITVKRSTLKALQGTLANVSQEIVRQIKPYEPVIKTSGLKKINQAFTEALNPKSDIFKKSVEDLKYIILKDPALKEKDEKEAITYQSLIITFAHRIAHDFYEKGDTTIARTISESAKKLTGAEIHPGATIGRKVFIDHPTGLVIGETAKIGDRFHGHGNVLLGSDGVNTGKDRHPIVGNDVTIWPHAKVHGGKVIGDNSTIGCDAVVTENVPKKSVVVGHNLLVQLEGKKTKINLKYFWEHSNGTTDVPNLAGTR